jgi:hypothetical protein
MPRLAVDANFRCGSTPADHIDNTKFSVYLATQL